MTARKLHRWQIEAATHAEFEYPREACGLVVDDDIYHPCRNTAREGGDNFRLEPRDYAAAEARGQVTAVVHSHPDASCHPSPSDRVACEASGLPWHVVGWPSGAWGYCAP